MPTFGVGRVGVPRKRFNPVDRRLYPRLGKAKVLGSTRIDERRHLLEKRRRPRDHFRDHGPLQCDSAICRGFHQSILLDLRSLSSIRSAEIEGSPVGTIGNQVGKAFPGVFRARRTSVKSAPHSERALKWCLRTTIRGLTPHARRKENTLISTLQDSRISTSENHFVSLSFLKREKSWL